MLSGTMTQMRPVQCPSCEKLTTENKLLREELEKMATKALNEIDETGDQLESSDYVFKPGSD